LTIIKVKKYSSCPSAAVSHKAAGGDPVHWLLVWYWGALFMCWYNNSFKNDLRTVEVEKPQN